MKKKLRTVLRKLEEAGAVVGMSEDMPDEVAEMFLRSILDCPDCAAALKTRAPEPREAWRHGNEH